MDSRVDERTLREIYLPAFNAAISRAGVRCVMTSYNPVNGVYASENHRLLGEILKGEWLFAGLVMSDWNSVYSTAGPVTAGLDLEMPSGIYMCREQILPLVESGKITEAQIDDKVRRILTVGFEMGFYDRPTIDPARRVGAPQTAALAAEAARQSIVLLKNEADLLPFAGGTVAVLGRNAEDTPTGGGGSSYVHVPDPSHILDALRERFGAENVAHVRDRGGRIAAADRQKIRDADLVVVCAGFDHVLESESYDRSWQLPENQTALIRNAGRLSSRVAVVLTAGGDVETASWLESAGALLHTFFLGAAAGGAIVDVLTGTANPSGKLPFTMARRWEDHPATASYVRRPDQTNASRLQGPRQRRKARELPPARLRKMRREDWPIAYREGLYVGYRHFDSRGVGPQFPFGHGLSYTRFALSEGRLSGSRLADGGEIEVSVAVTNTGSRPGAEVVQLYLHDEESRLDRPRKELKGFEKVLLQPGESRTVRFSITAEHLRFFDPGRKDWVAEPGRFVVMVGTSSRDIAFEAPFDFEA
jgi:beta-glucosidase